MDTFNFPLHTASAPIYPKGDSFQFGRGYTFSAAPQLPIQRKFKLYFNTLVWFFNPATGLVDATIEPTMNVKAMLDFYDVHMTHVAFNYVHPVYGTLVVKFAADSPLEIPKAIDGGSGAVEPFEILFIEQPL